MNFLNLTLVEFLAVLAPVTAAVVALYLYDRSRRRQVVSTLRFFPVQSQPPLLTRRKKIQQPWSLILQLVSIALLLAAIAEPVFRRAAERVRDHVLIVEASSWMNVAAAMPTTRRRALDYLHAVPAQDRVLLLRADSLPTPLTGFTSDRREIEELIQKIQPGSTALNLSAALDLARSLQKLSSTKPGEIALVGSGRVMRADLERVVAGDPSQLRAILAGGEPNDCGLRKLSARRAPADPLEWEIDLGAYNYGSAEHRHPVRLAFAGHRIAARNLVLAPHAAAETSFRFRSTQPGRLEAVLDVRDDYNSDNRAALDLPVLAPLKLQVFTEQPDRWRPLLTTSPFLDPEFHPPAEYTPTGPPRRLVILDGFSPAAPDADSLRIVASRDRQAAKVQLRRWNAAHPIAAGLADKDLRLAHTAILKPEAGQTVVAESDAGAVLVAADAGSHKQLLLGFHPVDEGAENHLAIPLLFANVVRWVAPDLFRLIELSAGSPGLIEVQTAPGTRREQIQVTSPEIRQLPFTLVDDRLRLFVAGRSTVRIQLPAQELVYSLSLPEVGETRWIPQAGVRQGVPPPAPSAPLQWPLWPWLALAGTLGLVAEWILYGRRPVVAPSVAVARAAPEPASEPQQVQP